MPSRVAAHPVHAIAQRLEAGKEDLARRMVARYAEDIVDYRLADEDFMRREVYAVSLENLEVLVAILLHGEPPSEAWLEKTRRGAAAPLPGRIRRGPSLPAPGLGGQLTGEHVLECAHTEGPAEREAALQVA